MIEVSRRELLVTKLSVGFALAVQPITAATITTNTEGMDAGEVKFKTADVEIPAYRAMPKKGNKLPVILVVQEIFGVHEHIKDICRRFAKSGYFAIAPELYARQGDVSKMTNIQEIVSNVVSKVPDAQVMSDLDHAAKYAESTKRCDTAKLGVTGFCWGGRITWLYAAHNTKLRAGVAWYGRLEGQPNPNTPLHPIEVVPKLKAPVLGLYGGKDTGIPMESVEKMREALKKAGSKSEIIVYPEAPHGFHADYRESYREADAKAAWAKATDWFKKHGVA